MSNIEMMSAKNAIKFDRWNASMGGRLQELRDKIAKARHAAEGVGRRAREINNIKTYLISFLSTDSSFVGVEKVTTMYSIVFAANRWYDNIELNKIVHSIERPPNDITVTIRTR